MEERKKLTFVEHSLHTLGWAFCTRKIQVYKFRGVRNTTSFIFFFPLKLTVIFIMKSHPLGVRNLISVNSVFSHFLPWDIT